MIPLNIYQDVMSHFNTPQKKTKKDSTIETINSLISELNDMIPDLNRGNATHLKDRLIALNKDIHHLIMNDSAPESRRIAIDSNISFL